MIGTDMTIQVMDILEGSITVLAVLCLSYHFLEFFCQVLRFSLAFVGHSFYIHSRALIRELLGSGKISLAPLLE